ncbi:MAG: sigma 54-interacting transcriptional regulator [Nannocystaceae bacterium]
MPRYQGPKPSRKLDFPHAADAVGRVPNDTSGYHRQRLPPALSPSPAYDVALSRIRKFAPFPYAAVVLGETGVGKELAAEQLHELSPRHAGPFVAVNCAAVSEQLAESEFFGHIKGSFTGAHRDHPGAFARARGGTLFLDEVGELPLALQAKLLRVLETRRYCPVGAEQELTADVRLVSATHRNLDEMVSRGQMREDFLHRIRVLVVEIPPLRERKPEIGPLMQLFLDSVQTETGKRIELSPDAVAAAKQHLWPGNIRELKHTVQRAAALAHDVITPHAIRPHTRQAAQRGGDITVPRGTYAKMRESMLRTMVSEQGSIRKAATVLGIPRSTLGGWLLGDCAS